MTPRGPSEGVVMSLFDDIARTDLDDALWREPHFSYLNRSARSTFVTIRATLDEWFRHVPVERRNALRQRFRSLNNNQHDSALFELVLHEMLLRLGCTVVWEPTIGDRSTRPDFLVQTPDGQRFYLEATVVTGKSAEEAAAEARMNEVYDAINRLESPNFFIGVCVFGAPRSPVPAKRLRRFLAARLAELDPDEVNARFNARDPDGLPRWRFEHDGWIVDFFPIPKRDEARGRPGIRPLAMFYNANVTLDIVEHVRKAVESKASRYGQLDLPYLIAVNVREAFREKEFCNALFGDLTCQFDTASGAMSGTHRPNGAWSGRKHTRVSAVLIADNLHPYRAAQASVAIWHNPWAARPATGLLPSITHYLPVNGRIQRRDGRTLGDLLNLPAGWPGEDD
jgi:hypothetical protein